MFRGVQFGMEWPTSIYLAVLFTIFALLSSQIVDHSATIRRETIILPYSYASDMSEDSGKKKASEKQENRKKIWFYFQQIYNKKNQLFC